jgi:response regulator of citrate/malate metabolism
VLTASADMNVVRQFGDLGISSYLLKPVSRKQLAEHIAVAMRHIEGVNTPPADAPGVPSG